MGLPSAGHMRSAGSRPLQAVEDQVEPVFELVAVLVSGLHGVFGDELDEIRVRVDGKRLEHRLRDVHDFSAAVFP